MVQKAKNPIQSVGTTFRILNGLKDLDGAGVTELANETGLNKSTVHNYLRTLENEEYVVSEDGTYYVGTRMLELGKYVQNRHDLYEVAKPEINQLAEATGELVNLLVEEHGWGVYLYRGKGDEAVPVDAHVGMSVHLHCTGLGKAILAYLPPERVESIVERRGLPAMTSKTITDRDELFDELDDIRQRGVAFDDEERLRGLQCIAVPIFNTGDEVLGAISVSIPTHRAHDKLRDEEMVTKVTDIANLIQLKSPV